MNFEIPTTTTAMLLCSFECYGVILLLSFGLEEIGSILFRKE